MSTLLDVVQDLLDDAGFTEELYVIKDKKEEVFVEFDEYEAVLYTLNISEEDKYKKHLVGHYEKAGKRHRIVFIIW